MTVRESIAKVNTEWKADSPIDGKNLEHAAMRQPVLNAKYLGYWTDARNARRDAETKLLKMKKIKERFYNSLLTPPELKAHGWEPYGHNKPLKSDMAGIIEGDIHIIALQEEVDDLDTMLKQLILILDEIKSRSFSVTNTINMRKFNAGE